jgi:hypothetical protein
MWLAHVTIGVAAISLLVAFVFGGGFGAHTTRKRAERAEQDARERIERIGQEARNRVERIEQEARNRVERIEREARKRVERAERERDFTEQLMHDLLNEAADKKLIQAKIALLAAAKGVSSGATEVVDVAKTGFRELRSRVSFWEKQPDAEILPPLK